MTAPTAVPGATAGAAGAAGAAPLKYEREYGGHTAISRGSTDGGYAKRCAYCAAQAEKAKKDKRRAIPKIHKSIEVCAVCVKQKRQRGRFDDRSIALCTKVRPGALHSCFWLWHHQLFFYHTLF